MANTQDFFLTVTKRVFSNWTALKMAVEHGMGTRDTAIDFCEYITNVIYMNEDLNTSEIACDLEDYMDQYFDTELQDYSSNQVAEELFKFYRYCAEGKVAEAETELKKLPPLQPWLVGYIPKEINHGSIQNYSVSETDETEETNMQVEDMEWTEVKTRRKK